MATSSERQNVRKQHGIVGTSLFCAIVLALLMVPTGASGQNGVAVIGPTSSSTPYGCNANPVGTLPNGIPQAISDAMNLTTTVTQHVVDASNCTSMTFTSEIDIGTGTTDQTKRIKFILPANGSWTANFSNSSAYALKWGDGVMIVGGTGSGEGQPFAIHSGASTLQAVCGNDTSSSSGHTPYFHVEGFSCVADAGATIGDAIIEITGNADESYLGHMGAGTPLKKDGMVTLTRGLFIHGSCCSATYEDINVDVGNQTGATPCQFGFNTNDENQGIHVSKLSCLHPGSGSNAILIQQTANNSNSPIGNSFRDIYMEQLSSALGGSQDSTTPWVAVRQGGNAFPAADLLDGFRAGLDSSGSNRYLVDIGQNCRVNISNLTLGDVSKNAINDGTNGLTVAAAAANSVIASYDMTPRYNLTLGALTVNTLPAASAANAGTMFMVTDSTNTVEGTTCTTGTGGTKALAFSTGT